MPILHVVEAVVMPAQPYYSLVVVSIPTTTPRDDCCDARFVLACATSGHDINNRVAARDDNTMRHRVVIASFLAVLTTMGSYALSSLRVLNRGGGRSSVFGGLATDTCESSRLSRLLGEP